MKGASADRNRAREAFLERFGSLYEHSPWIAGRVYDSLPPGAGEADIGQLAERFHAVVQQASPRQQLDLLNAHPELACAPAERDELTAESRREQSGSGLDNCSAEEYREFERLNQAYRQKFGFPFIIAVAGKSRQFILESFRERLQNDRESEFRTALGQVSRIARIRLARVFDE